MRWGLTNNFMYATINIDSINSVNKVNGGSIDEVSVLRKQET